MGHTKRQFHDLIEASAGDNGFAQDAIAWAITSGAIATTGVHEQDVRTIGLAYDTIIQSYRAAHGDLDAALQLVGPINAAGLPTELPATPDITGEPGADGPSHIPLGTGGRTEGERLAVRGPRPERVDLEPIP